MCLVRNTGHGTGWDCFDHTQYYASEGLKLIECRGKSWDGQPSGHRRKEGCGVFGREEGC